MTDIDQEKNRVSKENLQEVDLYMYDRLQKVIVNVREAYEEYDFSEVFHQIHDFCTIDLSSFYLDFAKDILYIEVENNERRRSIQTVYFDTLVALVKLIATIVTHTADKDCDYISGSVADN